MSDNASQKTCFVIGPIGDENTDVRNQADFLLKMIIRVALEPLGYTVSRADEVADPGTVTDRLIIDTLTSDLVIADLTGPNASAFYELGIRHAAGKQTIHMILDGQTPPFDVKDQRYIPYKLDNPTCFRHAIDKLSEMVRALEVNSEVHNPVTRALGRTQLGASSDSSDQMMAELFEKVDRLERKIDSQTVLTQEKVSVADFLTSSGRKHRNPVLVDGESSGPDVSHFSLYNALYNPK
ncbi:MAG: hypothetical protein JAY64_07165 [Candidatus Thiodiazotropha weberae]|nr:hypothetical protein [Candidatus Thiodiazotropha lotti]MCG8011468.1 hypothetical protein [Candidatus Thiodiazotropha lotti]MCW4210933.1 hypothetical protein [Candidatus Thiodiazotropha lotti]MCW4217183.1 hypothetical protein [Candidatus Thiodiazotropha lotti]